jgi:ethanolamine utilization protein EutN
VDFGETVNRDRSLPRVIAAGVYAMQLGFVIGTAVATVKHRTMDGTKLLVVQPRLADGRTPDGDPQLAIDCVGAGRGEMVLISSDGRYARELLKCDATPVRWTVIGIQD